MPSLARCFLFGPFPLNSESTQQQQQSSRGHPGSQSRRRIVGSRGRGTGLAGRVVREHAWPACPPHDVCRRAVVYRIILRETQNLDLGMSSSSFARLTVPLPFARRVVGMEAGTPAGLLRRAQATRRQGVRPSLGVECSREASTLTLEWFSAAMRTVLLQSQALPALTGRAARWLPGCGGTGLGEKPSRGHPRYLVYLRSRARVQSVPRRQLCLTLEVMRISCSAP